MPSMTGPASARLRARGQAGALRGSSRATAPQAQALRTSRPSPYLPGATYTLADIVHGYDSPQSRKTRAQFGLGRTGSARGLRREMI